MSRNRTMGLGLGDEEEDGPFTAAPRPPPLQPNRQPPAQFPNVMRSAQSLVQQAPGRAVPRSAQPAVQQAQQRAAPQQLARPAQPPLQLAAQPPVQLATQPPLQLAAQPAVQRVQALPPHVQQQSAPRATLSLPPQLHGARNGAVQQQIAVGRRPPQHVPAPAAAPAALTVQPQAESPLAQFASAAAVARVEQSLHQLRDEVDRLTKAVPLLTARTERLAQDTQWFYGVVNAEAGVDMFAREEDLFAPELVAHHAAHGQPLLLLFPMNQCTSATGDTVTYARARIVDAETAAIRTLFVVLHDGTDHTVGNFAPLAHPLAPAHARSPADVQLPAHDQATVLLGEEEDGDDVGDDGAAEADDAE